MDKKYEDFSDVVCVGVYSDEIEAAAAQSGGYLGQALSILQEDGEVPEQTRDFIEGYVTRNQALQLQALAGMEKWKRDRLIELLQQWEALFAQALVCRSGGQAVSALARRLSTGRGSEELLTAIRQLRKCIEYAQGNVSPAAICGYLLWALV